MANIPLFMRLQKMSADDAAVTVGRMLASVISTFGILAMLETFEPEVQQRTVQTTVRLTREAEEAEEESEDKPDTIHMSKGFFLQYHSVKPPRRDSTILRIRARYQRRLLTAGYSPIKQRS